MGCPLAFVVGTGNPVRARYMCVIGTTGDGCYTWHRYVRESVSDSGYVHDDISCMTYEIQETFYLDV